MSRILVLYGTTDGQTARIARALANTLRTRGVDVDVIEAGGGNVPGPDAYGGVIVAASVHGGRYRRPVRRWVSTHATHLNEKPTAFVSVCLAVLQPEPKVQHAVRSVIDRFLTVTGWRPTLTKPVAGAVLYTRYNWFKRRLMKRIVAKAGGDVDTSRDYEYTDWNELRTFAEHFDRMVHGRGSDSSAGPALGVRVA